MSWLRRIAGPIGMCALCALCALCAMSTLAGCSADPAENAETGNGAVKSTNPADPNNSVTLNQPAPATAASTGSANPLDPTGKFDPSRDPRADLQLAIAEATKTGKRIILDVGGEWCIWCHIMDKYFADHPALAKLRSEKFVVLKINYSEENENKDFLAQYPKIPGYPHLYVLESDGSFLHSQDTAPLEEGRGYDLERLTGFLKQWAKS